MARFSHASRVAAFAGTALILGACDKAQPEAASASGALVAAPALDLLHVRLVEAANSGAVDGLVRDALGQARAQKRTLIVYVGASWCEPCQRFHHAAESGALDDAFPGLTMLEFDLDRDAERLAQAGYVSKYIPLFALPTPDGRASGKQVEGGIKGEGAVAYMTPRLKDLLAQ